MYTFANAEVPISAVLSLEVKYQHRTLQKTNISGYASFYLIEVPLYTL